MSFEEKKFHFLTVDDTETNRIVIKRILQSVGYAVSSASSGFEAIELLHKGLKADLILLDIMMPEMNGFETCQIIKKSRKAMADVFDALDTPRPYKKRWEWSETLAFIQQESSKHFDPQLGELLLKNFGYFRKIRDKFPD